MCALLIASSGWTCSDASSANTLRTVRISSVTEKTLIPSCGLLWPCFRYFHFTIYETLFNNRPIYIYNQHRSQMQIIYDSIERCDTRISQSPQSTTDNRGTDLWTDRSASLISHSLPVRRYRAVFARPNLLTDQRLAPLLRLSSPPCSRRPQINS